MGFPIYSNMALIQWLSNKQPTIEMAVLDAEFVAMKHGIKHFKACGTSGG